MSPNAQRLLEEIRQLPPDEREWLIESALIADEGLDAADIESSWKIEVERRASDADAGLGDTYSWEEVQARLRARLNK